jgi:xanthine dehydrogenase/oxidase
MSLYALVRNAYDPVTKCFHLSESDIELEGHLDGNLCRCTGYKPILKAAKTFITEDLKGQLVSDHRSSIDADGHDDAQKDIPYKSESSSGLKKSFSCGRPGGCCRDEKISAVGIEVPSTASDISSIGDTSDSLESDMTSSASSLASVDEDKVPTVGASYGMPMKSRQKAKVGEEIEGLKTTSSLDASIPNQTRNVPQYEFKPYAPQTELLFPPSLRKFKQKVICFGDSKRLWLRPVTLQQLLEIKSVLPSAKLVGGSSEVQVEVRFKNTPFAVSVFVSAIPELQGIAVPDDAALASVSELVIGANTPLSDIESTCKVLYDKLGQRAQVLEAARKQLRYFAGRQIRNVASCKCFLWNNPIPYLSSESRYNALSVNCDT